MRKSFNSIVKVQITDVKRVLTRFRERHKKIVRKVVVVNGKRITYLSSGRGQTLLLLHGWPMCSDIFLPLIKRLRGNFRVLAPDLPGFGDSDELDETHNYRCMADHLMKFAHTVKTGRLVVAGVSFGAAIALEMGRRHPGQVKRLVVNSPPISHWQHLHPAQKILILSLERLPGVREKIFDHLKRPDSLTHRLVWTTSEQVNPKLANKIYMRAKQIKFRVFDETLKSIVSENLFEPIKSIKVPVVFICGERDGLFLEDTVRACQVVQKGELWRIPKAGHAAVITHADQMARLISFSA